MNITTTSLLLAVTAFAANASTTHAQQTNRSGGVECLSLTSVNGYTLSAAASAMRYSRENTGAVAISVFPGPDMRSTPSSLVRLFRDHGFAADCFVNDSMFADNGTSISFFVAGLPVEHEGRDNFGIQELRDSPLILRQVRTHASLARAATLPK